MAHPVTDRVMSGLRWTAVALYLLGVAVILGAMAFTHSVDALLNAVLIVGISFVLPATALLAFAYWLDAQAGDDVVAATAATETLDVRHPFREPLRGYLVAVVVVPIAWALRGAFDPVLSVKYPFVTFFLAVGVAGWLGGFGPAVLASALSTGVAWYYFVSNVHSFRITDVADAVGLGLFVFTALAVGAITAALHTALLRITELRARIAKLESDRRDA
jgi:hypothetical protein